MLSTQLHCSACEITHPLKMNKKLNYIVSKYINTTSYIIVTNINNSRNEHY